MKIFVSILFFSIALFTHAHSPGTPTSPPDSLQNNCDTLWLKSGKIMLVTLISDNGVDIKFSECPPNEIVSTIPKSATKLSPRDSILAAKRASQCDTIFVKGGEIITGRMKYYNGRKVVYTGCCQECTTEKILKRKDVDSIHYADGKRMGSVQSQNSAQTESTKNKPVQTKPVKEEEEVFSPAEQEKGRKRMKIFGALGLAALGIAVTSVTLLFLLVTIQPILFGIIFFVAVVLGLIMAMGYIRNKKKAGLQKKRDKN